MEDLVAPVTALLESGYFDVWGVHHRCSPRLDYELGTVNYPHGRDWNIDRLGKHEKPDSQNSKAQGQQPTDSRGPSRRLCRMSLAGIGSVLSCQRGTLQCLGPYMENNIRLKRSPLDRMCIENC